MNVPRLLLLGVLCLLAACGGGSGSDKAGIPAVHNTVAGVASAGIIKGGAVKVFAPYSSQTGADKLLISAGQTSLTDGSYSVDIGSYSGTIIVEVTGGSYLDEADSTAGPKAIPESAPLRAVLNNGGGSVKASVTALTELAVRKARSLDKNLGSASVDTANSQISDLFRVDIITVSPLDASGSLSTGGDAERDYTIALAAISQLTKSSGQTLDATLSNLAGAISSTGCMDAGMADSLIRALTNFLADTTNNRTGVTAVSDNLKSIGKTTLKLIITLSGVGVKGLEATIALPAGVTVAVDATGIPLKGVLVQSVGGINTLLVCNARTPGILKLSLVNADKDFVINSGDIVTVRFDLDAGAAIPNAAAFKLISYTLFNANGAEVAGILNLH